MNGKPILWIPDTSFLITLAVDSDLVAAVQAECRADRRVLLDVVIDELQHLAEGQDQVRGLAATALTQLAWLGTPLITEGMVDAGRVLEIQDIVRAGRPLRDPWQHWGESVAIAIAERLQVVAPVLLTEDYGARIEAKNHGFESFSVHKLLSRMVRAGRFPAWEAATLADNIRVADRGGEYTADEFRTGRLGRVGRP